MQKWCFCVFGDEKNGEDENGSKVGGKREKKENERVSEWNGGKCVGPTVCSDSKIQN